MVDRQDVRDFMAGFFGYGHLGAKYWFIGLEEGAIGGLGEFERRLKAWKSLNRPLLADIRRFHGQIDGQDWFRPSPPVQRTWRPLMRTRFVAEGLRCEKVNLRSYQEISLASPYGDIALIELLPLPARSKNDWIYGELGMPELRTRKGYELATTPSRRDRIIRLIDEHQPKAVVTYGDATGWRQTLGANEPINAKAWTTRRGNSTIVCGDHPGGARSNDHWDEIGRYLERSG